MRPSNLLTSFALFTALSTAWPTFDLLGTQGAARIKARQNNNNNNNNNSNNGDGGSSFDLSISTEQGNTATTRQTNKGDSSASSGGDNNSSNKSGNDKATTTSGGKNSNKSNSANKSTDKNESTKTFDNRLPAGGVQMVTPDPMGGAQYYKIKDYVTFGFNFTSVSVYPAAIDVLATCSLNSATYTIATNQSVTGGGDAIQAVTWDTGEYQATASVPLLLGTYTLMIHDAAKDIDATASAGYLGTWEQFTFGMYTPQPYTPLADYVCATCNGALSGLESRATLGFLVSMVGVTVLSFSWFAGVAGLW